MDLKLQGKSPDFSNPDPKYNFYRVGLVVLLIIGAILIIREFGVDFSERILPLIYVTPTPTRSAASYLSEAQELFATGELENAIKTYETSLKMEPGNQQAWAELARLLTYSSIMVSTPEARLERLAEAREAIHTAESIASDDSTVQAIKALVHDWSAMATNDPDQRDEQLLLAEQIAHNALLLDTENPLALAFYAEVLVDQEKPDRAFDYSMRAIELRPDSLDTHRVHASVLENQGQYQAAIEEYEKAINLNPNLTFLLNRVGEIYQELGDYDRSLEYFGEAISTNTTNQVEDPRPYIGIAETYSQMKDYVSAAVNTEQALAIDPTNPQFYGQLGIFYTRARDYESALPVLSCPVKGCSVDDVNQLLAELFPGTVVEAEEPVDQISLTNVEAANYYVHYGSVLAALSAQGNDTCPQALAVLEQVRKTYPDEPGLMNIVEENEEICRLIAETPVPTIEQ